MIPLERMRSCVLVHRLTYMRLVVGLLSLALTVVPFWEFTVYCQRVKRAFWSLKNPKQYVSWIQVCVWIMRDYFMIVDEVIWLQIGKTSTWKHVSEDDIGVRVWQTAGHWGFGNAHEWTVKSSGSKSGTQTHNGCGQAIKAVCTQKGHQSNPQG